ncbi:hypothetical protein Peur_019722 [Populus x canadensis]
MNLWHVVGLKDATWGVLYECADSEDFQPNHSEEGILFASCSADISFIDKFTVRAKVSEGNQEDLSLVTCKKGKKALQGFVLLFPQRGSMLLPVEVGSSFDLIGDNCRNSQSKYWMIRHKWEPCWPVLRCVRHPFIYAGLSA